MRTLARPFVPAAAAAPSRSNRTARASRPGTTIDVRLPISQAQDFHEREAERAARQVMGTPAPDERAGTPAPEHRSLQHGAPTDAVPASHHGAGPTLRELAPDAGGACPASIARRLGDGAPLDASSRSDFEPRFARDFGKVRIHSGPRAAAAAAAVNARAFAVGRDIVFAAGAYAPSSESGRRLLAHELAHVVQQSAPDDGRSSSSGAGRLSRTPVGVHRAVPTSTPAPTEATEPFPVIGNEAGAAGARRAADSIDHLLSAEAAAQALQTIPITDPQQKQIVIQQVLNSPAVMRTHAEQGRVRQLSQQEFESGQQYVDNLGGASAFADAGRDFVYITSLGRADAFVLGHEFSHIQSGPVRAEGADPELAVALGNLNTEVRAAFVDYALLQLQTLQEEVAAGMPEASAVAAFSQRYSGGVSRYVARTHGSVSGALEKLAGVVTARRAVEMLPTNLAELGKAVMKGYVSEADLALVFSREVEIDDFEDPFEMAAP